MTRPMRFKFVAQNTVEKSNGTPYPYVGLEHVESETGRLAIEPEEKAASDSLIAEDGDVLFGKLRPYLAKTFRVRRQLTCSGEFLVLRPKPGVDTRFIEYVTRSQPWLAWADATSYGSKMPRTSWDFMGNLETHVPSITQQQVIADFLDRETAKIDALIDKQEQLIATLREDRATTITHAVTKGLDPATETMQSGSKWLGPIPIHWSATRLRNIVSTIESGTSVNCSDVLASAEEVGVLKTSCVSSGKFDPAQHKTANPEEAQRVTCPVTAETIIVNRANAPDLVGSAGYVKNDVPGIYLSDLLWSVTVVGARPDFVHAWMQSAVYRTQVAAWRTGTSASMQKLSKSSLRSFEIALPPLEEQGEIVEFLASHCAGIDTLIDRSTEMIDVLSEYRSALITNAVTGKIDVREAV